MKKLLLIALVLALLTPALAIDKHGLLSVGGRIFYWLPQGNFGEAYDSSLGFGAKVGYGISSQLEVVGEAWYGMASFNEHFWGLDYADNNFEDATPYLTQFSAGARYNFSPYSPFDPYVQVAAGYYMWAMYKQVWVDENDNGQEDPGEREGRMVTDESTSKFGINARIGGEFFTSNQMSIDVAVGWNSIFGVTVPVPRDTDSDGFYDTWDEQDETVHILTFGAGFNLYL